MVERELGRGIGIKMTGKEKRRRRRRRRRRRGREGKEGG
jgi:hypothetical protein